MEAIKMGGLICLRPRYQNYVTIEESGPRWGRCQVNRAEEEDGWEEGWDGWNESHNTQHTALTSTSCWWIEPDAENWREDNHVHNIAKHKLTTITWLNNESSSRATTKSNTTSKPPTLWKMTLQFIEILLSVWNWEVHLHVHMSM